MRKKENDEIFIFNDEEEWLAEIEIIEKLILIPKKFIRKKSNKFNIWIYFGLIKNRNLNFLIEKVTEIGVNKIIPIQTAFSENINIKYDRLKKIIIEATEQSDSLLLPKLEDCKTLKGVLNNWDKERLIIFCDEKLRVDKPFKLNKSQKVAIFIGPVGGWSIKERELFENINHNKISLGENVLKVDTAAIVALAKIKGLLI
jgi:16S rRNA (uracil1498-N3)-methyltransferase